MGQLCGANAYMRFTVSRPILAVVYREKMGGFKEDQMNDNLCKGK